MCSLHIYYIQSADYLPSKIVLVALMQWTQTNSLKIRIESIIEMIAWKYAYIRRMVHRVGMFNVYMYVYVFSGSIWMSASMTFDASTRFIVFAKLQSCTLCVFVSLFPRFLYIFYKVFIKFCVRIVKWTNRCHIEFATHLEKMNVKNVRSKSMSGVYGLLLWFR